MRGAEASTTGICKYPLSRWVHKSLQVIQLYESLSSQVSGPGGGGSPFGDRGIPIIGLANQYSQY